MEIFFSAIMIFAVTNIDDIIILSLFFSDRKLTVPTIVAGQFIGIGVIVVASAVGALLASALPTHWIALLGLVPIFIGVFKIMELFKPAKDTSDEGASAPNTRSGFFYVTTLTVANGGDNIGLYIPLFSTAIEQIYIYATVFMAMTGVWCFAGYKLTNWPPVASGIERFGKYVLPAALILIGAHIFSGFFVIA